MDERSPTTTRAATLLSIVLPSYSAGAHLVARTLHSFAGQSSPDFEVLVVDDGAIDSRVRDVAESGWPFPVRYLVSPRVRDRDQAHKNHARNLGWRHAAGDLVFMVDCDCMAPPEFVDRVLTTYHAASAAGDRPVVLYPLIQNLHQRFNDWIAREGDEALQTRFADCIAEVGKGAAAFGGHLEKYRDEPGAFVEIPKHAEGFQVLSKRLIDQLGGFDEDFLAWGANKEEFQQRINEVGAIRKLLAVSCVVYHQPHPKNRDNKKLPGNAGLMHGKARQRRSDQVWKRRKASIEAPETSVAEVVQRWRSEGTADLARLAPDRRDQRVVRIKLSQRNPEGPVIMVGPWVGEFGWQCCRWQGGVRKRILDRADAPYVIVVGDPGCQPFYEYVDEYWWTPPFVGRQGLTRNMTGWVEKRDDVQRALRAALAEPLAAYGENVELLEPRRFAGADQRHGRLDPGDAAEAERTLLTERWGSSPWVCLFPRERALNAEKNWPAARWQQLAEHLHHTHGYRVVICGGKGDTAKLDLDPCWALDLTQIPLERRLALTIAFLEGAHAAVASESGGCQLALLCGTPTVVMGGTTWQERVTVDENYLDAPCRFLASAGYRHEFSTVRDALEEMLADLPPRDEAAATTVFRRSINLAEKVADRLDAEPVLAQLQNLPHVPDRDRQRAWFKSANYYPVLAALVAFIEPARVLEIGTRYGYGLVSMVVGSPSIERIVAADDESEIDGSQVMALENVRAAGYAGSCELLVGDGGDALSALRAYERFDLVYLDADVEQATMEAYIRDAWLLLKPGGYLLVDDIDYVAGVRTAFEAQRGRFADTQFTQRIETFRGLGVMRKLPVPAAPAESVEAACAVCAGELSRIPDHDEMQLLRCAACGLIQVDLTDPAVCEEWTGYYSEAGAYHRQRQLAGFETFLHRYLHDRQLAALRLENLLRLAPGRGRLLDVGCSNGALVRAACDLGFDAEGIDVDPWAVHHGARLSGCNLVAANPLEWDGGPYDVVTVIDVFEHFPTPKQHLAHLRELLVPGGLLVIEMPDAGQGGVERLGVEWRHFKPREHAFLYAQEHTHRLLEDGGFELVDSLVPFPDRRVDYARRVN